MIKARFVIPLLIGLPLFAYLWTLYQTDVSEPKAKTALQKAGDECASIAENAVANMNAVVAFQMLEKEGRKINVMRRCMADHGYKENPKKVSEKPIPGARGPRSRSAKPTAVVCGCVPPPPIYRLQFPADFPPPAGAGCPAGALSLRSTYRCPRARRRWCP